MTGRTEMIVLFSYLTKPKPFDLSISLQKTECGNCSLDDNFNSSDFMGFKVSFKKITV